MKAQEGGWRQRRCHAPPATVDPARLREKSECVNFHVYWPLASTIIDLQLLQFDPPFLRRLAFKRRKNWLVLFSQQKSRFLHS